MRLKSGSKKIINSQTFSYNIDIALKTEKVYKSELQIL
jgi:hypothetical protein